MEEGQAAVVTMDGAEASYLEGEALAAAVAMRVMHWHLEGRLTDPALAEMHSEWNRTRTYWCDENGQVECPLPAWRPDLNPPQAFEVMGADRFWNWSIGSGWRDQAVTCRLSDGQGGRAFTVNVPMGTQGRTVAWCTAICRAALLARLDGAPQPPLRTNEEGELHLVPPLGTYPWEQIPAGLSQKARGEWIESLIRIRNHLHVFSDDLPGKSGCTALPASVTGDQAHADMEP